MRERHLVVSAVNFSEGGPLTILRDSLAAAAATLDGWRITALVHDHALLDIPRVETLAFPQSKSSWFRRIGLEWWGFAQVSRQLKPDLWLSLHDMTPRVKARRQAVYCHNPSPFYAPSMKEAWYDPGFFAFNKLYLWLYRAFIGRNDAVIVQQEWLRRELRRYHRNVIVAHPGVPVVATCPPASPQPANRDAPLRLLYPALPRVFKNIETVCEAVNLVPKPLRDRVELRLTMDGSEGRWARALHRRYGNIPAIRFIGRQDRAGMAAEYADCDMVVFPSRLETWGLPITEAKAFAKPLLVADLPYAHETVGHYADVSFLDPADPAAWAAAIETAASGGWIPQGQHGTPPAAPFFADWPSLWAYLTKDL